MPRKSRQLFGTICSLDLSSLIQFVYILCYVNKIRYLRDNSDRKRFKIAVNAKAEKGIPSLSQEQV